MNSQAREHNRATEEETVSKSIKMYKFNTEHEIGFELITRSTQENLKEMVSSRL